MERKEIIKLLEDHLGIEPIHQYHKSHQNPATDYIHSASWKDYKI